MWLVGIQRLVDANKQVLLLCADRPSCRESIRAHKHGILEHGFLIIFAPLNGEIVPVTRLKHRHHPVMCEIHHIPHKWLPILYPPVLVEIGLYELVLDSRSNCGAQRPGSLIRVVPIRC